MWGEAVFLFFASIFDIVEEKYGYWPAVVSTILSAAAVLITFALLLRYVIQ